MERGLTKKDMERMTVGEIVDLVIAFNERQEEGKKEEERKSKVKKYRLATPAEVSAYNRS